MEQHEDARFLRKLIEREAWEALPDQYEQLHVQDIAAVLEELRPE